MYAVTGSTGQLGRFVIDHLLTTVRADQIVAIARTPEKASDLADKGVQLRKGDYDQPDTLASALEGVDRLLLISASDLGRRAAQHKAVIDAAKEAGVQCIVYTSILHADTSKIGLAEEHRQTEGDLAKSGVPHAVLRNGWYFENYTGSIGPVVEHGVVLGSTGDAKVSPAARADFAEAAAVVLTSEDPAGKMYELAGDGSFTMAEYAAEITKQSGKQVAYQDLPPAEYEAALEGVGLPTPVAQMLAQADAAAREGALYDDSHTLSKLIGRPTASVTEAVADGLAARR